MTTANVVLAWKDEEYRASLSLAEQALLPAHPAGLIELRGTGLERISEEGLEAPTGAALTFGCCSSGDACSGTHFFASIGCCPSAYYPCSD